VIRNALLARCRFHLQELDWYIARDEYVVTDEPGIPLHPESHSDDDLKQGRQALAKIHRIVQSAWPGWLNGSNVCGVAGKSSMTISLRTPAHRTCINTGSGADSVDRTRPSFDPRPLPGLFFDNAECLAAYGRSNIQR
jgi:hypothetical protein